MLTITHRLRPLVLTAVATLVTATCVSAQSVYQATLNETNPQTLEISTTELQQILSTKSATVFDARPHLEFSISHIPGALNVAAKPGVPLSVYVSDVAEIARVLHDDRGAPIVLYCNGPFCGKSKRLATELLADHFTNVRRYQLGIPTWRALVGLTQIEADGMSYVFKADRTAVWVDVRGPADYAVKTIHGAVNIPRSLVLPGKDVGEIKLAKDDGRLPIQDHNTRIIVLGASTNDARYVAQAIANEAFHNVSFFDGNFESALAATKGTINQEGK
jgi:rhodanese-related sulfurtransferase